MITWTYDTKRNVFYTSISEEDILIVGEPDIDDYVQLEGEEPVLNKPISKNKSNNKTNKLHEYPITPEESHSIPIQNDMNTIHANNEMEEAFNRMLELSNRIENESDNNRHE